MDHLSHPLPRQSPATQFQFDLHRRSRPSALRLQGRLPRRILRRCPAYRSPSNLRGYLCPLGYSRRLETRISPAEKSAAVNTLNPAPRPRTQALPCVPPCPLCLKPLTLPLTLTLNPPTHNCERPMNSSCGKNIRHPRTKPVIVEDTTCCVSLLTGTISGSNFAFP
jgi:hypothetical protein